MVRPDSRSPWFSGLAWFAVNTSWSSPWVFNFLAWKPLHLKNLFFRSGLSFEVVFRPKSWIPVENLNLYLLQTYLSLKTRPGLVLGLTMTKTIHFNFFKKIKSANMPIRHVKGQPDSSTNVRKNGCPTCDTHRGTPCRSNNIKRHLWMSKQTILDLSEDPN